MSRAQFFATPPKNMTPPHRCCLSGGMEATENRVKRGILDIEKIQNALRYHLKDGKSQRAACEQAGVHRKTFTR